MRRGGRPYDGDVPITVAESRRRLLEAAGDGALARLADDCAIDLIMLFGSAADDGEAGRTGVAPGDIDLAVGFRYGEPRDFLGTVNALAELVPGDHLDVVDLDRAGPVARERALRGGRVLYQRSPAAFFEREIFAMKEYMETRELRARQLAELASAAGRFSPGRSSAGRR